jgi:hypothetical protein
MAWAAQWLAKSKKSVLAVARREVRSRRWNQAEMTESLRKMDIVPPPPKWSGSVTVALSFDMAKAGGVQPTRLEIRAMLKKLLDVGNDDLKITAVAMSDNPAWTQS